MRPFLIPLCLVLAAPASAQTLPPGKPAGVKTAASISYRQFFIGASVVAVILTFTLPASSTTATTATTS